MNIKEIEYMNALGPFDHGVWEGKGSNGDTLKVGGNALFLARSEWLVEKVVRYLSAEYSESELAEMSLLEIGSYDGWVVTQVCKQLKFLDVKGIEPRRKNILKGEAGRRLQGVETQAEFILGGVCDLDRLFNGRKFDIVISLGMLHHVSSTYDTILQMAKYAKTELIIDSMIIPELESDTVLIEPYVNTRDIVYFKEEKRWAIAAFKHESPYGDGSCSDFGIVNIPSASLIRMSLENCGFGNPAKLGDEGDFFSSKEQGIRGVRELLIASKRSSELSSMNQRWRAKVSASESIFCNLVLPEALIVALVKALPEAAVLQPLAEFSRVVSGVPLVGLDDVASRIVCEGLIERDRAQIKMLLNEIQEGHFLILSVIFRLPFEKIVFEAAKYLSSAGYSELSTQCLRLIVSRPGCDWWSFYRSCYLLQKAFGDIGDSESSAHYRDLLLLSNENFPFLE